MKTAATLFITVLFCIFLQPFKTNAQCHIDDWTALKALYESTNGNSWIDNNNWGLVLSDNPIQNCNLNDLYGVHLNENGRVNCIDLDGIDDCDFGFSNSGGNNLLGSLSNEIGNLIALEELYLGKNKIDGEIPSSIGDLSNLIYLDLGFNELEGAIPFEIGNLTNLVEIKLFHNELEGIIPPQLGNLVNLTNLSLAANQLIGLIPPELGNLSNLYRLSLHINNLSGNIPPELGNLTNLNYLYIGNNQLNGYIPNELQGLSSAVRIDLSYNHLIGNIPPEFCTLNNLISLDVNNNQLSGCYHEDLLKFCTQLDNISNPQISDGNNFATSWEDFCATNEGLCTSSPCNDDVFVGCIDPIACNYHPNATCNDDSCDFTEGCINSDVYPGDLNHDGIVNNQDVGLAGLFLYEVGPPRDINHQNTDWNPYPVVDWGRQQLNNEDIKHFDCHGDGVIMDNDHQAVMDNLGQTWTTPIASPPPPPQSDFKLMLLPAEQLSEGYLLSNLSLERRASGDMDIQGGYFTIDYSEIEGTINFVTLGLYNQSWLGNRNDNLFYEIEELPEQQKIEVGFTKTDYVNSTGNGIIGELIVSFSTNLNRSSSTSNNMQEIRLTTIGVHNGVELQLLEDEIREVCINCNTCEPNWTINEDTPFQNLYSSDGNISTDGFVLIGVNQEVQYKATRITLNSGFGARAGTDFKVRIGGCN